MEFSERGDREAVAEPWAHPDNSLSDEELPSNRLGLFTTTSFLVTLIGLVKAFLLVKPFLLVMPFGLVMPF